MSHTSRKYLAITLAMLVAATGCHPMQPTYFFEDGDMSHYMDVATDIEYPDVDACVLDEVTSTRAPLTLENADSFKMWDLSLEEVVRTALSNSKVIRSLGGVVQNPDGPNDITAITDNKTTVYDPALVESGAGFGTGSRFNGQGVEGALAEFDAQWTSSVNWFKNDRPVNRAIPGVFVPQFKQDGANFNTGIRKQLVTGGAVSFQNNTFYDSNNNFGRPLRSDWNTNFEMAFSQPLLQGAGTQFNRIAGPVDFNTYDQFGTSSQVNGVVIARLRTDSVLADFEIAVTQLLQELEQSYCELYFQYRSLESLKTGRDSALQTWRKAKARLDAGQGSTAEEAQARAQYFQFRALVENSLTTLYSQESNLRYLMGISSSDGRLIRPIDEPTTARVTFDWNRILIEGLARRPEIRKQKWAIKRREMEIIAAKNYLMPRLDANGTYRWLGLGDKLWDTQASGLPPTTPGSNAAESLFDGDFQEWELGLQLSIPIGFRRALSNVRHTQLMLTREKALLEDEELEVSHQLAAAIRNLTNDYNVTRTNFNRRVAAQREVEAMQAAYEASTITLDLLLDAQRRLADAEVQYYRTLIDYNCGIMQVHYSKGTLLEFDDVYLAEGPWPGKAYFDACREARKRDASTYLDYGFTRPKVFSRGPYMQHADEGGTPIHQITPLDGTFEEVPSEMQQPTPATEPMMEEKQPLKMPQSMKLTSAVSQSNRDVATLLKQQAGEAAGPVLRSPQVESATPNRAAHSAASGPIKKLSFEAPTFGEQSPIQTHPIGSAPSAATSWKRADR